MKAWKAYLLALGVMSLVVLFGVGLARSEVFAVGVAIATVLVVFVGMAEALRRFGSPWKPEGKADDLRR